MLKIRRIEEGDLDNVLRLCQQLDPGKPPEERNEALWRDILADPGQQMLVVEDEEKATVATCGITIIKNLTRGGRPAAFVENVVVDEAARGRGIGKQLLNAAIDVAKAHNCYKIFLLTGSIHNEFMAQNVEERHKFYLDLGFRDDIKTGFVRYLADDL